MVVDHPETLVAFGSLTETRTLLAVGGLMEEASALELVRRAAAAALEADAHAALGT